jgi:dihydrofolate reductase
MSRLTFSINVTLDGCCDHREGIADAELHDHFTQLIAGAGAMLFGRNTYELMEAHWPAVARDEKAARSDRDWALQLEAMPKHVVSTTRREYPWHNSFHVDGDVKTAAIALKETTPRGVLVGSHKLGLELEKMGLIDDYHLVIHPVLAGHGPTLFQGLAGSRQLELISMKRLTSGAMAMHYRRKVPPS